MGQQQQHAETSLSTTSWLQYKNNKFINNDDNDVRQSYLKKIKMKPYNHYFDKQRLLQA